ncbi:MAG: tRNA preQ1(34) S-adenosylmethionine ribosyltransferase-isomerase QueA [Candidatus Omnitrophota bacterium]
MNNYTLSDFDYNLPKELIAQYPIKERGTSRLLMVERKTQKIVVGDFINLIDFLNPGDVIVLNNTKVIKARLIGKTESGIGVDALLVKKVSERKYEILLKPLKKLKEKEMVYFNGGFIMALFEKGPEGKAYMEFDQGALKQLDAISTMPLPPYIKRLPENLDLDRYQTVYAQKEGSIASPTAGLHFTEGILDGLNRKGINVCYVSSSIGYSTFKKIKNEDIKTHTLEAEYFSLSKAVSRVLNSARARASRILSVGTSSTRVLETCFENGNVIAREGHSDLFIHPPFKFNVVNMLLTNFHMPKTTLIMLACAFCGRELLLKAYDVAIKERFRFLSYGDAMLIV